MKTRNSAFSVALVSLLAASSGSLAAHAADFPFFGESSSSTLKASSQETLYLSIVDGLIKQNRQGAALAFLDSYRQTGQTLSPRYWLLRGNALLGAQRDTEAMEAFSELRKTPLAAQGWNGQGRIAAGNDDWLAASECFRKAVDNDPANADFLNNLAFAELHLDNADNAALRLQQAHELEPGSDRILTNLVIALILKGDRVRADAIIDSIRDVGRRDALRGVVKGAVAALSTKGKI
ncbi:MAG TPA: hypothetical protein VMF58_01905 [Rhizomicrobium sp.]|nr:hypothetical protein [Rhizomicrobium sp.]